MRSQGSRVWGTASPVRPRIIAGIVLLWFAIPVVASAEEVPPELHQLLDRLDATAHAYAEHARSFTCEETIRWTGKFEDRRRKFGYVVVLGEDGKFDDYRTRVRHGKSARPPKRVRPEEFGVPAYLRSAYLWSFIFKRDRWPHHRYELAGEGKALGLKAVVIRFEPIPPYREAVNIWFGEAWVDPETAQLLKVTAHRPEDEETLHEIAEHRAGKAVNEWVYVMEEITTEFGVAEQGLRFPSRVELKQVNYDFMRSRGSWKSQERTVLTVEQRYSNYRFYEVETTVEPDRPKKPQP